MFKIFTQIGKDALIIFIGTISTSALGFILMPLYTHVFSTAEYGLIEIVNISSQMVAIIMAFGIPSAFNREFLQLSETDEQHNEIISTSFLFMCMFSFIIGVIVYASSDKVAFILNLDDPIVPRLFRLIAIKTYFLTMSLIAIRYLIVTRKMAIYAFLSFSMAVLITLVSLWVLLLQNGGLYELYFYQTIVTAIFGISYSSCLLYKAGFHWSGKRLRSIFFFALPMVPSAVSFYIMTASDRYFLQQFTSTADVGIYGISYKIGSLLLLLVVGPLTTSLSPYIYRIAKHDNCGIVIQKMLEIVTFILFASAGGLGLASPYLIRVLAPPAYWSASSVVIWIAIAYAFYGLNFVLVAGINISGKSYYQMIAIFIAATLNLILNYLFIAYWGIIGAAIATTIAYVVQTLLTGLFAQRLYRIPYRFFRISLMITLIFFSYWVLTFLPMQLSIIMVATNFVLYSIALLIVVIVFFKRDVVSVWNKIQRTYYI